MMVALVKPLINMVPLSFILLQAVGGNSSTSLISLFIIVFIVFAVYICGFVLIRSIVLWYWKVDVGINNQEQQTALLIKQNHLLEHQIKLLSELNDQMGNLETNPEITFKKHKKSPSHSTLV
jgi:hypothetical protein